MDSYISSLGYDFLSKDIELPLTLQKIVYSEFITENDIIVLGEVHGSGNPSYENDLKKCEFEYNETHFHPDAFADKGNGEIEYLKLALECAKRLIGRLDKNFKDKKFRVLVSFSETEIKDGEIESYGSSTVRFYQIRSSCERIMRMEDLNSFKIEAILEIEN